MPDKQILHPHYIVDYDDALGIDCDQSAADVAVFTVPPEGCTVLYAACCVTETCAGGTTTPIVKFDKRPTAGSDTSRTDGDIATIALGTTEAGKIMFDRAGEGEELNGGEEIVVQMTANASGTSAAGHFRPILAIIPNEELVDNIDNGVETA